MTLFRTLLATLALGLGVTAPAHAIVGGNDPLPGEYPYVAHVVIDRAFQCTGTLVTSTHVVTAAHCSSLAPGGVANVPIGQPGQLIELVLVVGHPPVPLARPTDGDAPGVAVRPPCGVCRSG